VQIVVSSFYTQGMGLAAVKIFIAVAQFVVEKFIGDGPFQLFIADKLLGAEIQLAGLIVIYKAVKGIGYQPLLLLVCPK